MPPVLIVAGTLAGWEALVRVFDVKPYLLPAPTRIAGRIVSDWPIIYDNFLVTLEEIALGFMLAVVVSMILGTLIAHWGAFRRGVYPLVIASQTVPIIAIAPVLVIWFGYSIVPRVLVTALIAFFPLVVNVVTGFRAVEREFADFFRSLEATPVQMFFKLSLPSAMPYIFAGLKISITLAVIGATVSEWIGAEKGLGSLIFRDTSQLDTVRVFAAIVMLSVCGIGLFSLVALIERVALPWRYSDQAIGFWSRLVPQRLLQPIRAAVTMEKET